MSITINSISEIKKYKQELAKIKIFVCSTACGKTYLCNIDKRFYDLDAYRSKLMHKGIEDYDEKSIPKMYEILDKGKIILNASHGHFMNYIYDNKIPFVYMYGKPEVEEEYIQRMKKRGSSQDFIDRFAHLISEHYDHRVNDNRATYKIEMTNNEYVSDYLFKIFGPPQKDVFVFDVDGTLADVDGKINDTTYNMLKTLSKKSYIIYSTGRDLKDFKLAFGKNEIIGNFVICNHGAVAYNINSTEPFIKHTITKQEYIEIVSKLQDIDWGYKRDSLINIKPIDFPQEALSIDFVGNNKFLTKNIEILHKNFPQYNSIINDNNINYKPWIVLTHKKATKGKTLNKILFDKIKKYNKIYCFGDSQNDLSLFDLADVKVAVGNACQELKEKANFIVAPNYENGIAKFFVDNMSLI